MRALVTLVVMGGLVASAIGCGGTPDCKDTMSSLGGAAKVCGLQWDREKGVCVQKAQICPDRAPINFCDSVIKPDKVYAYDILLSNYGEDNLVVSDLKVLGDENCSFKVTPSVPLGQAIKGEDAGFLHVEYDPQTAAADQVTLEIKSNAENYPDLKISLCGRGIAADATPGKCGLPDGFQCSGAERMDVKQCGG